MVGWGIRVDRCGCLRRPLRMSAPTVTDVCADRCGCLRRPLRMSAPTDADVCVDRYRCLRRPMRMVKYAEGVGKKGAWEVWEVWEVCVEGCVRGMWEGCVGGVRGYGRMPYPPMGVLCR